MNTDLKADRSSLFIKMPWKAHRNRAEPSPDQEAVLMWSKFPLQQLQKKSRRLRHSQMDPPEQLHLLELFA